MASIQHLAHVIAQETCMESALQRGQVESNQVKSSQRSNMMAANRHS